MTTPPAEVWSVDPATGLAAELVGSESTSSDVDAACRAAAAAAAAYDTMGRGLRARLLDGIADALEVARAEIVPLGCRESGLPEARLEGELTRTVHQARHFAEVVRDGGYVEATIDHAGDSAAGATSDLRRMLVPLGPVAVFGASNFPLAFSVAGGDTVSALAAGCPVVVKAHDSHPALSVLVHQVLTEAARAAGAPEGLIGLVHGFAAGRELVLHPLVRAVGFTGSQAGGRALLELVNGRPDPIPFYGELAGLNPVVVTAAAAAARPGQVAAGLVASVSGSAGQLCTKPGLVLLPHGPAGDAVVADVAARFADLPAMTLLNSRIAAAYGPLPGELVGSGAAAEGPGFLVSPRVYEVDATDLDQAAVEECFGPTTLLVRYRPDQLPALLAGLTGSLACGLFAEPTEDRRALAELLRPLAGRLVHDGWPTGVQVSWAQHHGGPWPATNTLHTSVGAAAVRRFLRPFAWQSAPPEVLPDELLDVPVDPLPRRVDGHLVLPSRARTTRR